MVDNCTCWNLESIRIKKWFISVHIQILKIQGYLRRMVMTKILPETKLEPKLTKSVAFAKLLILQPNTYFRFLFLRCSDVGKIWWLKKVFRLRIF